IAYEHASQDNLNGLLNKQKVGSGNQINDAMQGVKGVFNFPLKKEDFLFLGVSSEVAEKKMNVSVDMFRGGYLDSEIIDANHPYSTVWTATGFYDGNDLATGKAMIRNYLFHQICEKPAPRTPEYYYNTWGLQREDRSKPLRGILTYDRIFKEIDNAAELGVDIFVLDDGWENMQGEWFPNKERLPQGLAPIKERLDKYGIKMGLWFSPMGIDTISQRYKEHPDWVIKDSEGNPILAQWDHPAFDFVGGFFNVFINDCKKLIDQGCRFMKWDAINTFYSRLPNLEHGSNKYSEQEIRARYEYLLPIYVTRAMEILTDYEPDLVIEMDLTEARRVMVGLAPLSQGKVFWMNNGASSYNDYSTYRSKSMRTIANEFAGIIPLELFTYANYPQNVDGCMKYNVANSLLAGHGFWGNLELMTSKERKWVGEQVRMSKKVLPFTVDVNPQVIGKVGDSPEIYSVVNKNEAAGQIIVFSEDLFKKKFSIEVKAEKLLAVLNQPFTVENDRVDLTFQSSGKESSFITFVLPNENSGVSMYSSTEPVIKIEQQNNRLEYIVSAPGEQVILWNKKRGKPVLENSKNAEMKVSENNEFYRIDIKVKKGNVPVVIQSE
ncbi:MAG TPA: alpha-galactosidase, partial [Draconibacterium sp.]|nr:alpha-galactosidase [Draconibacterium sp.]